MEAEVDAEARTGGRGKLDMEVIQAYLQRWAQHWDNTGELWKKDWDTMPLPTMNDIKQNLPPGGL